MKTPNDKNNAEKIGRVTLNPDQIKRVDGGICQILEMTETEILERKEVEDERIASHIEIIKRKEIDTKASKRLTKIEPIAHPVFGLVRIPNKRKPQAKIRAIVNFLGNEDDLKNLGIKVQSGFQNVFTIIATRKQILTLASQAATQKISIPRLFTPFLQDCVPTAEMDQIHSIGSRGNGIIVGVIDSPLQLRHHAFLVPNSAQDTTRIKFMWVQDPDSATAPGQTPEEYFKDTVNHPNSPDFTGLNYGRIYDEAAINNALSLNDQTQLNSLYGTGANQIAKQPSPIDPSDPNSPRPEHGTHTTGIAAGSGHGADWLTTPVNVGSAPLADIVHVCYRYSIANYGNGIYEDDILNALRFIFRVADHEGQPAVISNSYGGNLGPHNGSTDFDTARNALIDSFTSRSIVYAAGNDNAMWDPTVGATVDNQGHRKGVINASATDVFTYTNNNNNSWLEIYYSGPDIDIKVDHYDFVSAATDSTGWVTPSNSVATYTMGSYSIDVENNIHAMNGLRRIRIFFPNLKYVDPWTISLRNNDPTTESNYWAWTGVQGNWASLSGYSVDEMTLSDTCCARSILSVGSCAKQIGGAVETIAVYSGRGPTLDGRIKPEITAVGGFPPGNVNSADSLTRGGYVGMVGTSMAAPLVAGAIALLFEENPELDQDTIKGLLTRTADRTNLDIDPDALGYDPKERNAYGLGRLRMLVPFQHSPPLVDVDVWVRTANDDYGFEPYPGNNFCNAPEVHIIDQNGVETTSLNWKDEYTVRLKVHNLGDTPAIKTKVQIKYTRPWTAPDTWTPCTDTYGNPLTEEINIGALDSNEFTFGAKWQPKLGEVPDVDPDWGDHFCMLIEIDHENDPLHFFASGAGDAWDKNIKGTNNVALRNLAIK